MKSYGMRLLVVMAMTAAVSSVAADEIDVGQMRVDEEILVVADVVDAEHLPRPAVPEIVASDVVLQDLASRLAQPVARTES